MSNQARWIGTVILIALWLYGHDGGGIIAPKSAPIPVNGLHVLIVEETGDRTPAISTLLNSQGWQSLVPANQWRVYDPDADLTRDKPLWRDAMARPRTSVPWLIVSNHPHGGYEGPLPGTVEELSALVRQWGSR